MLSKTFITALGFAVTALAAPHHARDNTTASGLYFQPSAWYNYHVNSGAIDCNVQGGIVDKSYNNQGKDITTLATFTYPPATAGQRCQLAFYLDNTAPVTGSGKIDVFTRNQPAPGCTTGWGPGNQRGNNIGRWSVAKNAFATWDATFGAYLTAPTACKPVGTQEGFEFVGVYDNDHVAWNPAANAGARIYYFP